MYFRILHKTPKCIILKEYIPPKTTPRIQSNFRITETIYVMYGYGEMHYNEKIIELNKKSSITIPPGKYHGIETYTKGLLCLRIIEGDNSKELEYILRELC